MRYWDDMNDKYAFGDGGSVPPDAWACRSAYVLAVNGLAELRGSLQRVVGFDRGGVHNPCLILMVPADCISKAGKDDNGAPLVDSIAELEIGEEEEADGVMMGVIDELMSNGCIDEAAEVKIRFNRAVVSKIIGGEKKKLAGAKKVKKGK